MQHSDMDGDHHLNNTATDNCNGNDNVTIFGKLTKPNNWYFHGEKAQQEQTNGHINKHGNGRRGNNSNRSST